MELIQCSVCGSEALIRTDHGFKCAACGATYADDSRLNDETALTSVAFQLLRRQEFGDAEETFADIIQKYPGVHSAYWGRVLARYGIKYEDDYNGQKIPTCCMPIIESFGQDKDFLKAVELAPEPVKVWYLEQSEYIDRVRKTWVEKASREKPYDIFICYKDSDLGQGIQRTKDSYEAFEIYTKLKETGYRVFYSRESLRDKIGEKYEPYIYNALQTAKVMVVYASSVEYVNSTWLKNEWHRYLKKIENDEKREDSLFVVCDGFSIKELPTALAQKQCVDTSKKTWFYDLSQAVGKLVQSEKKKSNIRLATKDFERITEAKPQEKKKFEKIHEHHYQTKIIPATCINRGYTLHYCECGEEYRSSATELVDHQYKLKQTVAPTCTESGKKIYVCTVCGDQKVEEIPATGHQFGEWLVQEYPQCEKSGMEARQCKICGFVEKEPLPKTGHTYGKWVEQKHATCANEGTETRQCETCGKTESRIISKKEHDFGQWQITGDNQEVRTCRNCGAKEIRPHDLKAWEAKRKRKKRIAVLGGCFGVALIVCIVCHVLNVAVFNVTIDGIAYQLEDGNYIVTGAKSDLREVVIPSDIYGKPVLSIGDHAFENCSNLTSVTISDSVISIANSAFSGCINMTNILIGNGVASIGESAFSGCSGLTRITIPGSVTSIGVNAFFGCKNLIQMENGICYVDKWAIDCDAEINSASLRNGTVGIGSRAFSGCHNLTSIAIPDSVINVGFGSFSACTKLIQIENGIYYVEKWVVGCDPSVTDVTLSSGTIGICSQAFYGCDKLTSITMPDSMRNIGVGAFYDCSKLSSITIPDGITKLGDYVLFGCNSLTHLSIPNSVTSIGYATFSGSGLKSINMPNNVTYIGEFAFYNCDKIQNITIPDNVTHIGDCAFYGWKSTQSIYCKVTNKPSGWDDNWNDGCNAKIVWGANE